MNDPAYRNSRANKAPRPCPCGGMVMSESRQAQVGKGLRYRISCTNCHQATEWCADLWSASRDWETGKVKQ
jgi:hypothetical protein